MNTCFPINQEDLAYLSSRDSAIAEAIALIPPILRPGLPNSFYGLLHAISGQQISGKAHQSIWARICTNFSLSDPAQIAASEDLLRTCGLSQRKTSYICNIARLFAQGDLKEEELRKLPESDLRSRLLALPGVGPWTVDMLLIFAFQRKNILSEGDAGIQRGLRMLYGLKQISHEDFEKYHLLYSPVASIASLYLWEIASGRYTHWKDPLAEERKPRKQK